MGGQGEEDHFIVEPVAHMGTPLHAVPCTADGLQQKPQDPLAAPQDRLAAPQGRLAAGASDASRGRARKVRTDAL